MMMNYDEDIRRIIDEMNVAPEDDFDGFPRREMRTIIYSPFADECPIRIRRVSRTSYDNNK